MADVKERLAQSLFDHIPVGVGSQGIIPTSPKGLEAALEVWGGVDMADLRARSVELSDLFIKEVEARCPAVTLAAPRDSAIRGSQVMFRHPEGFAVMQALVARGVIGDFRAPDGMRFGFAPLYNDEADVIRAATTLQEILDSGEWDQPKFRVRGRVT